MTKTLRYALLLSLAACGQAPSVAVGSLPANCAAMDQAATIVQCKGSFTVGKASTLCPTGYILATTMPTSVATSCLAVSGSFFAADMPFWADPTGPLTNGVCGQQANWYPGTMGCGTDPKAYTKVPKCGGWPGGIVYSSSDSWGGNVAGLSMTLSVNPDNGVLCSRQ